MTMLPSLEPLEEKFRQVEEDRARRAMHESEARQRETLASGSERPGTSQRNRRKGSISVSRFGQPKESEANGQWPAQTASPLANVATRSTFYHTLANPRSVESFYDSSCDSDEEASHVTQMQQIAGRPSLPKAMGSMLTRRLSRARSQNVRPSSGNTNLLIGVSVEEATVQSPGDQMQNGRRAMAYSTRSHANLRARPSAMNMVDPRQPEPPANGWMGKAKELGQKFRRKSRAGEQDQLQRP